MLDPNYHFLHIRNLLGLFIVNRDVEFSLEIEEDVEAIERIYAKFLKCTVWSYGLQRQLLLCRDYSKNSFLNGLAHR